MSGAESRRKQQRPFYASPRPAVTGRCVSTAFWSRAGEQGHDADRHFVKLDSPRGEKTPYLSDLGQVRIKTLRRVRASEFVWFVEAQHLRTAEPLR